MFVDKGSVSAGEGWLQLCWAVSATSTIWSTISLLLAQPTQMGQSLVTVSYFGSLCLIPRLRFQSTVLFCDQNSEPETSQTITQISLSTTKALRLELLIQPGWKNTDRKNTGFYSRNFISKAPGYIDLGKQLKTRCIVPLIPTYHFCKSKVLPLFFDNSFYTFSLASHSVWQWLTTLQHSSHQWIPHLSSMLLTETPLLESLCPNCGLLHRKYPSEYWWAGCTELVSPSSLRFLLWWSFGG